MIDRLYELQLHVYSYILWVNVYIHILWFLVTFEGWSSNNAVLLLRCGVVDELSTAGNNVFCTLSRSWSNVPSKRFSLECGRFGGVGDGVLKEEPRVTPEHIDSLALLLSSSEEFCVTEGELILFCSKSLKRVQNTLYYSAVRLKIMFWCFTIASDLQTWIGFDLAFQLLIRQYLRHFQTLLQF